MHPATCALGDARTTSTTGFAWAASRPKSALRSNRYNASSNEFRRIPTAPGHGSRGATARAPGRGRVAQDPDRGAARGGRTGRAATIDTFVRKRVGAHARCTAASDERTFGAASRSHESSGRDRRRSRRIGCDRLWRRPDPDLRAGAIAARLARQLRPCRHRPQARRSHSSTGIYEYRSFHVQYVPFIATHSWLAAWRSGRVQPGRYARMSCAAGAVRSSHHLVALRVPRDRRARPRPFRRGSARANMRRTAGTAEQARRRRRCDTDDRLHAQDRRMKWFSSIGGPESVESNHSPRSNGDTVCHGVRPS